MSLALPMGFFDGSGWEASAYGRLKLGIVEVWLALKGWRGGRGGRIGGGGWNGWDNPYHWCWLGGMEAVVGRDYETRG